MRARRTWLDSDTKDELSRKVAKLWAAGEVAAAEEIEREANLSAKDGTLDAVRARALRRLNRVPLIDARAKPERVIREVREMRAAAGHRVLGAGPELRCGLCARSLVLRLVPGGWIVVGALASGPAR